MEELVEKWMNATRGREKRRQEERTEGEGESREEKMSRKAEKR